MRYALVLHTPVFILVFGIEYALLSQIHSFCPNFAICILVDPIALKFWFSYSFCGEIFGFLPLSSTYFPFLNLGLNLSWGRCSPPHPYSPPPPPPPRGSIPAALYSDCLQFTAIVCSLQRLSAVYRDFL